MIFRLACGQEVSAERPISSRPLVAYVGDAGHMTLDESVHPRLALEVELRRVAALYVQMAEDLRAGLFTVASTPSQRQRSAVRAG